jgi:hypothetical protein
MNSLTLSDPCMGGLIAESSMVTRGLKCFLDASNKKSYPGYGQNWRDMIRPTNYPMVATSFNPTKGGAISFSNGAQECDLASAGSLDTNFSISIGFYLNDLSTQTIIGPDATTNDGLWLDGNQIVFYYDSAAYSFFFDTVSALSWIQASLTMSNNTACFYLNGVRTFIDGAIPATALLNNLKISNTLNPFNGLVSYLALYDVTLTAAEALQNYNANKSRYL